MTDAVDDGVILPANLLAELRKVGSTRRYAKNVVVVTEGDPAEALYIVVKGRLRVYVSDEEGREVELNQHGPDEYFGELMLGSGVRTASVKTIEASELCMVRRSEFQEFISQHPELTFHLIGTLIHRVKLLTQNVQSLALMDVYGRVVKLFNESSQTDSQGRQFLPGISQQKIAEKVGASRGMVNRIIKDLTEGGYISVSRERIDLNKSLPKKW